MTPSNIPGEIVLFGSGETSASGRKIFERVMSSLPASPNVVLLETPAGFELNSAQVIGRVGKFLRERLQNYKPQIQIVAARKRGTPFSPDNPEILQPLLSADMIFMGPGSPTYAVRQLKESIAWHYFSARHFLGATLALASAASVAISAYALPVYEIYKVGEELHWKKGLDFFGRYGLPLVFIPHWNNNDGGQELDTSHCFMGKQRFLELIKMLPPEAIIIGLDEKTGLIIKPQSGVCEVIGLGGVTLIYGGEKPHENPDNQIDLADPTQHQDKCEYRFNNGQSFLLNRFKSFHPPEAGEDIPGDIWELALNIQNSIEARKVQSDEELLLPDNLRELAHQRQNARQNKDWQLADRLREQIYACGWAVIDTPEGQKFEVASKDKD